HGYQILAEDVVQVRATTPMQLWGLPWKFHLLPDAVRFFPELAQREAYLQTNGEWKLELELDVLYPGRAVTQAAAGRVIFLERNHDLPACLELLSAEEARARFEVIWSWDLPWPEAYEQQLETLLAQGVYRLRMDGSPDDAVALLDELVQTETT
ncbi:MAG: hypothetical protein KC413_19170, partial [Anaerolineales bacterium]|nr:hypothetical protein [Anaerolineales bacterium]